MTYSSIKIRMSYQNTESIQWNIFKLEAFGMFVMANKIYQLLVTFIDQTQLLSARVEKAAVDRVGPISWTVITKSFNIKYLL